MCSLLVATDAWRAGADVAYLIFFLDHHNPTRLLYESFLSMPDPITVIGRSLGSIPAVYVASQRRNAGLGGLVLISALASGARCVLPCAYVPNSPSQLRWGE
jgi:pimeloyl-ACP methyl ester carboxylesterase